MFFKNNVTGLVWEVVNPDQILRCENDPDYTKVEEPVMKEHQKKATPKAEKPKRKLKSTEEGE